ncbi:MAG: ACT domain-containing protein, partial [Ferrovum sp.]|nr:ACT domain-containing protein [Ferrovum sp.]
TLYYGAGAGAEPTGSAVVADLVDIARMASAAPGHRVPYLAFQPDQVRNEIVLPMADIETAYYLRMKALDRPGVLAEVTRILADQNISIEAMLQKEPKAGETWVDVIMLTQVTQERAIDHAIALIEALVSIDAPVVRLRVESLAS